MFLIMFLFQANLILIDQGNTCSNGMTPVSSYSIFSGTEQNVFNLKFRTEILIGNIFFIGGSMDAFCASPYLGRFSLMGLDSHFQAGIRIDGFEIGFEHSCDHPIHPWGNFGELNKNIEVAQESVYIKFQTKYIPVF